MSADPGFRAPRLQPGIGAGSSAGGVGGRGVWEHGMDAFDLPLVAAAPLAVAPASGWLGRVHPTAPAASRGIGAGAARRCRRRASAFAAALFRPPRAADTSG